MARYVLEVMYDGTKFHGSQVQGDIPTVQLAVNSALATLFRFPVETFGASRTDEGVHALCNCYHFDMAGPWNFDLQYKLNAILPAGLAVSKIYRAVNDEFNARFDALRRQYRYRIYHAKNPFLHERALFFPYRLSLESLRATAAIVLDYTDFESFSKRNTQSFTFNCTIEQSYWEQSGEELHYVVEANRFLRGMVRGLVATQLHIARGKGVPDDMKTIIAAKDCTKAFFNVTGNGLYLEKITYPEGALMEL